MAYKVGDRVIDLCHQEDLTVVEVKGNSYLCKIDRLPDVQPFSYFEHELQPWKYRRFKIAGDHYMKMFDCSNQYDEKFCGSGSWGVRDDFNGEIIFYITSGASRLIAMEICKAMNAGTLLKEFVK